MEPIYTLVIILTLTIILYRWEGNISPLIENYTEDGLTCRFLNQGEINNFFTSSPTNRYLSSITPSVFRQKTNGGTTVRRYTQLLHPMVATEQAWIRYCLSKIPTCPLTNLYLTWKFIGTSDTLEAGMPYTIGEVIFLPPSFTVKNYTPAPTVTHTLCHEWIHVLQRKFPFTHYQFITRVMGFRRVRVMGSWKLGKYQVYSNPDGLQLPTGAWVFADDRSNWYLPLLLTVPPKDQLHKLSLQVKFTSKTSSQVISTGRLVNNITPVLGNRFRKCPSNHLYHPHEILAELGADYLMDGTTGSKRFDGFYQTLGEHVR
jgi:hypothetical protein